MNSADGLTPQQFAEACGIPAVLPVQLAARRRRALKAASPFAAQRRLDAAPLGNRNFVT